MKKFSLTDMLIFVVSAELTGAVSALLSGSFRPFYESVENPPLAPPAFLFPVVWTLLYALMGISSYIVWDSRSEYTKEALTIYGLLIAFFIANPMSPYYKSDTFATILQKTADMPRYELKQTENKLKIVVRNVPSLKEARTVLSKLR